jgi:oxalate---CoA ligase
MPMTGNAETLLELLAVGKDDARAISGPGLTPLPYARLRAFVGRTLQTLHALGVGRNDPVAIVLPNGPEMAVSFLSVAAGCTAAPLNPAYRADELEFYLADLQARLLIVEAGKTSPAVQVAQRLGVPLAALTPTPQDGAGTFRRSRSRARSPKTSRWSFTPRGRPRGPRSCRCPSATCAPQPGASARHWL